MTLNQKQAVEPDEDGWYPARAVSGGFSVLMPVPFNDLTIVSPVEDGAPVTSDTVRGRSREGARFMANCIRRSDGKMPPNFADRHTARADPGNDLVRGQSASGRKGQYQSSGRAWKFSINMMSVFSGSACA